MPKLAERLLRPDMQRKWEELDGMPTLAVIIDQYGHAWQHAHPGYWYRAFDATGISPFDLAQRVGAFTSFDFELMPSDEERVMDWLSSSSSARIARVIAEGQRIVDERFADGVFE